MTLRGRQVFSKWKKQTMQMQQNQQSRLIMISKWNSEKNRYHFTILSFLASLQEDLIKSKLLSNQ